MARPEPPGGAPIAPADRLDLLELRAIVNYAALGMPGGVGYYIATCGATLGHAGNDVVTAAFYSIRPGNGERTVVTLASQVDCGSRPPQRLIGRLIGRRLGGASDTTLKGLAEHLAASVTSGPAPGDSWTESIKGAQR